MKTRTLVPFFAAAALLLGTLPSGAQETVSTGTIQGVVPQVGTLTIRSDQTTRPLTFWGMDRANIFTADGQPAVVGDLVPGMRVTVQYAVQGKRWLISKVILDAQRPPVVAGAPIYVDPALNTPAARDGDITTTPGSAAAVDRDITTQPADNAAFDGDITTRPASESNQIRVRRRGP